MIAAPLDHPAQPARVTLVRAVLVPLCLSCQHCQAAGTLPASLDAMAAPLGSLLTRHRSTASLLLARSWLRSLQLERDGSPWPGQGSAPSLPAHGPVATYCRLQPCTPGTGHGRLRQPLPSSLRRCYFTFLLFTPRDFLWGLGQFAYILIYKKLSGAGCRSESDLPVLNLKELNNFPLLLRCVESDSCSSHHLSLEEGAEGLGGVEKSLFEPLPAAPSPMARLCRQRRSHPPVQAVLAARDHGI